MLQSIPSLLQASSESDKSQQTTIEHQPNSMMSNLSVQVYMLRLLRETEKDINSNGIPGEDSNNGGRRGGGSSSAGVKVHANTLDGSSGTNLRYIHTSKHF